MIENLAHGLTLLDPHHAVVVTREEHHQGELSAYEPVPDGPARRVAVELVPAPVTDGVHAGAPGVEVRLGGRRIGELTHLMAHQYGPFVQEVLNGGGRPGAVALVDRSRQGLQVELRLPHPRRGAAPAPVPPPAPRSRLHRARVPLLVGGVVVALLLAIGWIGGRDSTLPTSPSAATNSAATVPAATTPSVIPTVIPAVIPTVIPAAMIPAATTPAATIPAGPPSSPTIAPPATSPSVVARSVPVPSRSAGHAVDGAGPARSSTSPRPATPKQVATTAATSEPVSTTAANPVSPTPKSATPSPATPSPATPEPSPPDPVTESGGCDANYIGCVPVDSDVDCRGGSSNGPSHVTGAVRVTGGDIHGLGNDNNRDDDGDGIGCDG